MNLRFWTLHFWQEFGYSLGSSSFLAKKMIQIAKIQDSKILVELWAWSGQVTKYIIEGKSKDTRFIAIENNHSQVLKLNSLFPNECEIHELSAAHLDSIIETGGVDTIISTLPLGSISQDWVDSILRSIHRALTPGGKFIQYQYWMYNRSDIQKYFEIKRTYFEIRNFWPAFIYEAIKK